MGWESASAILFLLCFMVSGEGEKKSRFYPLSYIRNEAIDRTYLNYLIRACASDLLLVEEEVSLYGASYGATYHGVVTDTQEAHHLYVCGN